MGSFTYRDLNYKVYGDINNGTVLTALSPKEEHRDNLFSFLHATLGIMNYTCKSGQIFYEVKSTNNGYSMTIDWISTKLKSLTTQNYIQLLKAGNKPTDVSTDWRRAILRYSEFLVTNCRVIEFQFSNIENEFKAKLACEINFGNLYSFPKGEDKVKEDFNFKGQDYSMPLELIENSINENVQVAFKYFGNDHQKLFDVLRPFEGKEFLADFLVGATYYIYLQMPNKAYAYFKRALNTAESRGIEVPPSLHDFIGNIEFTNNKNPDEAERSFVKGLLAGNEQSFLKLAYLYLQQGQNEKKEKAFSLAQLGEKLLLQDQNEDKRKSGYHIIASVYLWNEEFLLAENAHQHFLSDMNWCDSYPDLVKAYLLLSVARNNSDFMTNIITDYSFLTKKFPPIFDCWYFDTINPYDKRFKGEFIETLRLLDLTKKTYSSKA